MPKDIRSFFGGKPPVQGKPARDPPKSKGADPPSDKKAPSGAPVQPPVKPSGKKSKYFAEAEDDDDVELVDVPKEPAPARDSGRASGKGYAGKAVDSPIGKRTGGSGAKGSKKRAVVVVSDDDDDDDDGDVYMQEEEKDDEEDEEFEVESEEEDDRRPSKRRGQATQKSPKKSRARVTGSQGANKRSLQAVTPSEESPSATKRARAVPSSLQSPVSTPNKAKTLASKAVGSSKKSGSTPAGAPSLDNSAKEAIAAVEAAAKKLPKADELDVTFISGEWGQGNDNAPPPNAGNKDIPRGHPDCFSGKAFVFTGVLDSLYRHEAEDLVKRHGGRVTKDVSGKTSFLVVGLNCSKRKFDTAVGKNIPVMNEDGMLSLIAATTGIAPTQAPAPVAAPVPEISKAEAPSSGQGIASGSTVVRRITGGQAGGDVSVNSQLWVDKYKPQNSSELVGNNMVIATLRQWLTNWEAVHLHGQEAPEGKGKFSGGGAKPKDMTKKGVLLTGPPGIGKTSSAHIIARECGYNVVEVNASDTRSKSDSKTGGGIGGKLSNQIREMATNTSLAGPGAGRQLLIMDECDGMSGGDRGGIADLIQTLHRTKIPIICIANDKYNQKLKSLRNHLLELDYRKPTTQQISKRVMEICRQEGLQLNQATLDALIEGANGDVRLILGQLQMIRLRAKAVSFDEVKGRLGTSKDMDMSPFECARRLLDPSSQRLTMMDRMEMVFQDMDLVPLLVQENYLNHRPVIAGDESQRLRAIAKAAHCFSSGDVINRSVRQYQNWMLMPAAAVIGTVMPATYMRGMRETFGLFPTEQNFPRFTAWLGNQSSTGKQVRLLGELTTHMQASGHMTGNRRVVRLDYLPSLRYLVTRPLLDDEDQGVAQVITLMQDYLITREQFDFIQDITHFKTKASWNEDLMKDVPTKLKSAFTRSFNQQGLKIKTNTMVEDIKKGRTKARPVVAEDEEGGAGEDLEAAQGVIKDEVKVEPKEDEEELSEEELQTRLRNEGVNFQPKATKASGKGKTSGKASGAKGRGSGVGRASGSGARGSGGGRGRGRGKN